MTPGLLPKIRRGWFTAVFILSPLFVGLVWSAFGHPEDFGAFVLSVFVSLLFAGIVLARWLLKKSERNHPLAHACLIVISTLGGIFVIFVAGSGLALFSDTPDGAAWRFTYYFMIFAPIALIAGITIAITKLIRTRRTRDASSP